MVPVQGCKDWRHGHAWPKPGRFREPRRDRTMMIRMGVRCMVVQLPDFTRNTAAVVPSFPASVPACCYYTTSPRAPRASASSSPTLPFHLFSFVITHRIAATTFQIFQSSIWLRAIGDLCLHSSISFVSLTFRQVEEPSHNLCPSLSLPWLSQMATPWSTMPTWTDSA